MSSLISAPSDGSSVRRQDSQQVDDDRKSDAVIVSHPPGGLSFDSFSLSPFDPAIMSKQATINIGTIGHVAHGKSTVVRALSGVNTVRFGIELSRNITMKLGYANAKIYKCNNPRCLAPGCYKSYGSDKEDRPKCERPDCGGTYILQRHVSFVDCPGHEQLMATMLNGAAVMDGAILLIAANEPCPRPQTAEHLAAAEIMRLKNLLVVQNKIDLVTPEEAQAHHADIKAFTANTVAQDTPVIPVAAQQNYNIDVLCEYICTRIPPAVRDYRSPPEMVVVRSFDVNKPGDDIKGLKGGVAGGSIVRGLLRLGDDVEIRPGVVMRDATGALRCFPILTRITSLLAEKHRLEVAVPGGLIGVGTNMDPSLARADRLVGQTLGLVGQLPPVYCALTVRFSLLRRVFGVKADDDGKLPSVKKIAAGEVLMVNVGAMGLSCRVVAVTDGNIQLELVQPVCTRLGACVTLSRRVDKRWRLIGWAKVHSGTELQPGTAMSLDVVQASKGAYAKSPAPLEHVAKIATMMQFKSS